jgi:hypothetical protein
MRSSVGPMGVFICWTRVSLEILTTNVTLRGETPIERMSA